MQTMCLMKFKAWGKAKNPEGQVGKISIGISLCWAKGLIKVEVRIFYYYPHLKEWKKLAPTLFAIVLRKTLLQVVPPQTHITGLKAKSWNIENK